MKDVSELLTAISPLLWPIGTFLVIFLFRKNIQDVFSRIHSGKVLGQEIVLSEAVEKAKSTINELQELSKIMGSSSFLVSTTISRAASLVIRLLSSCAPEEFAAPVPCD